jgi:acetyltransferase-like isoleucine patch superfamily enzyme
MGIYRKVFHDQAHRLSEASISSGHFKVSLQLAAKVGPMAARGVMRARGFKRSQGIPLVGRGVRIRNPQFISVGHNFIVEDSAELQGLATGGLVFGDSVSIGTAALIRPSSYYSRDIGVGLIVGDNSSIGPQSYIGCSGGIVIGKDVMLGPGVRLFSENHVLSDSESTIKAQGVVWSPITIEDGCWIASGVTITAGVRVGAGAVVGAGSVVTHDVAPGTIVAGSPARPIGVR